MNTIEPPVTSLEKPSPQPAFKLWREVRRTYGFPLVMFLLAIVPGLNFTYSGHGGPSWFFIPLCAPYILLRAIIRIIRSQRPVRFFLVNFFVMTIPCYVVLAYPLSWAATTSIHNTFGLTIPTWDFMKVMISPYPYWYFS